MIRPREGHDLHIDTARLEIELKADVHWLRDIYGNALTVLDFEETSKKLRVFSDCEVSIYDDEPREGSVAPQARSFPPIQRQRTNGDHPSPRAQLPASTAGPCKTGSPRSTSSRDNSSPPLDLLKNSTPRIFESFKYAHREEAGVQLPCRTIELGTGSCRDFAVFMMEAARHLGLPHVLSPLHPDERRASTPCHSHAWTEIYIPGAGWRGFDPTNNKPETFEHVSVGVAREHDKASSALRQLVRPRQRLQPHERLRAGLCAVERTHHRAAGKSSRAGTCGPNIRCI